MNPINTALLSFGLSGRAFHAPFIASNPAFRLVGVWERSRKEAASIYPGIRSYDTLEQVLADPEVELVIVNTPNYSHFGYTRQVLEAGKHAIVEKPFVVTAAEGEALRSLADAKGMTLSVYQNRRWDSDLLTVKQVLESGALGEVVEAAFHFDRFKEELSPKAHKEEPLPGTGVLYDLGSHLIDGALHLFGMPQAIFADIRTLRPGSQVDDYCDLQLRYPTLRVRLHASYFVREAPPAFQLYGRQGSFLKPRADIQESMLQSGAKPETSNWGMEPESGAGLLHGVRNGSVVRESVQSQPGNYNEYFDGVAAAIRTGSQPPVTAEEGINVIRIIEAAYRSAEAGSVVQL